MLETHEAAEALLQLLNQPLEATDTGMFELVVEPADEERAPSTGSRCGSTSVRTPSIGARLTAALL